MREGLRTGAEDRGVWRAGFLPVSGGEWRLAVKLIRAVRSIMFSKRPMPRSERGDFHDSR